MRASDIAEVDSREDQICAFFTDFGVVRQG